MRKRANTRLWMDFSHSSDFMEFNLRKRLKNILPLFLFSIFIISCSSLKSGHYIQLRKSDNLDHLAKHFKISKAHLLNANRDKKFRAGEWWFIPLKIGVSYAFQSKSNYANIEYSNKFLNSGKFLWPVPSTTRISSNFGRRWGRPHTGIDIPGKRGAEIIAAGDGVVTFSGRMSGYGKVVVIKHANGFATVYAHNRKNFVKKGQKIARGQLIGQIGKSGKATGYHLHFEIRKNQKAVNPIAFIRKSRNFMLASAKR